MTSCVTDGGDSVPLPHWFLGMLERPLFRVRGRQLFGGLSKEEERGLFDLCSSEMVARELRDLFLSKLKHSPTYSTYVKLFGSLRALVQKRLHEKADAAKPQNPDTGKGKGLRPEDSGPAVVPRRVSAAPLAVHVEESGGGGGGGGGGGPRRKRPSLSMSSIVSTSPSQWVLLMSTKKKPHAATARVTADTFHRLDATFEALAQSHTSSPSHAIRQWLQEVQACLDLESIPRTDHVVAELLASMRSPQDAKRPRAEPEIRTRHPQMKRAPPAHSISTDMVEVDGPGSCLLHWKEEVWVLGVSPAKVIRASRVHVEKDVGKGLKLGPVETIVSGLVGGSDVSAAFLGDWLLVASSVAPRVHVNYIAKREGEDWVWSISPVAWGMGVFSPAFHWNDELATLMFRNDGCITMVTRSKHDLVLKDFPMPRDACSIRVKTITIQHGSMSTAQITFLCMCTNTDTGGQFMSIFKLSQDRGLEVTRSALAFSSQPIETLRANGNTLVVVDVCGKVTVFYMDTGETSDVVDEKIAPGTVPTVCSAIHMFPLSASPVTVPIVFQSIHNKLFMHTVVPKPIYDLLASSSQPHSPNRWLTA